VQSSGQKDSGTFPSRAPKATCTRCGCSHAGVVRAHSLIVLTATKLPSPCYSSDGQRRSAPERTQVADTCTSTGYMGSIGRYVDQVCLVAKKKMCLQYQVNRPNLRTFCCGQVQVLQEIVPQRSSSRRVCRWVCPKTVCTFHRLPSLY